MKDLKDLFVHGLRDMYCLEKKLLTELKTMKTQNEELSQAFLEHREETQGQIDRLIDLTPNGEKCEAKEGILEERNGMMEKYQNDDLLDAIMIKAGVKWSIVK